MDYKLLLETIVESNQAGIWDWDLKNSKETLSDRFKEIVGHPDLIVEPKSWHRNVVNGDLEKLFAAYDNHVSSKGKVGFDEVIRFQHADGSIVFGRFQGRITNWSEDGQPLRALGTLTDVTTEREYTESLERKINFQSSINNLQNLINLSDGPVLTPILRTGLS